MSRLTELLRQVQQSNPNLAADLSAEVNAITARRSFGLHFERHTPETVELPSRIIRKGDKVRFLPERSSSAFRHPDNRIWRVTGIRRDGDSAMATLVYVDQRNGEFVTDERKTDDLVVVAISATRFIPDCVPRGRSSGEGTSPSML